MAPTDYPFYAGKYYANRATAPFRVTNLGKLYATGAEISGKLTCGTGSSYDGLGFMAYADTVEDGDLGTTIISGGKIITGLLTASNITTGTLNASLVTITNLSASAITTGTLNASLVTVTNLNATNITTGTMTANKILGGTLGPCTVSADNITIGGMNAARITAGTLNAGVITVTNLNASNITTGTLTGRALTTAASGARAIIDNGTFGDAGTIYLYDASRIRTWLTAGHILGFDTSGNMTVDIVNYPGSVSYVAKFWQNSSTAAAPVLYLQQDDVDKPYIAFYGGFNAGTCSSTSTGSIYVSIDGVLRRIPYY
jgi:hypothetical protein